MKQRKKGFTLVELIVVIAIIGILAAVLIPTFSGAIESARYANDQAAARNMSTIIKQYCLLNGVDEEDLQAPDIRYIINTEEEFYTFRASSSDGVFWYNRNTGNVEVTHGITTQIGLNAAAQGESIEEVISGQIYLNTSGTLANFLNKLRNLSSGAEYAALESQAGNVEGIDMTEIVTAFDPANTLYVGSGTSFTEVLQAGTEITQVVFADGLQVISGSTWGGNLPVAEGLAVQLPVTVRVVEQQNPLNDLTGANLSATASNQSVTVVEGAFSNVSVSGSLTKTVDSETYNARVAQGNALIKVIPKAAPSNPTQPNYKSDSGVGYYVWSGSNSEQAKISLGRLATLPVDDKVTNDLITDADRIAEIVTKDLMEAFPTIHTLNIVYNPTKTAGGAETMDVHVTAIDNMGKVVDLIIVAAA